MAHTPGPWTIEYETEGGEPYDDGVRIDSPEGPVAFNVIDCSAHLIAAAPDMLLALRRLSAALKELEAWREMDATHIDQLIAVDVVAEQAIAKAEGRTDDQ